MIKTSSGLLHRDLFTNASGWTNSGGFSAAANPGLVCFGRLPIDTITRTVGGPDEGGCREAHILIDGDDYTDLTVPRRMFYGAGAIGNRWRPNMATSTDGGLTFSKQGGWGPGLSDGDGGQGGEWSARDLLIVEKRGGQYQVHAMMATSYFGEGNYPIPGFAYMSDVWTIADLANWANAGSFTFVRRTISIDGSGPDQAAAYMSCPVNVAGTYHAFYSSVNGTWDQFGVGRATATSPLGPYTKQGQVLSDTTEVGENPKVFWSATLSKYVMLQNRSLDSGPNFATANVYWLSDSISDWSAATKVYFQRKAPADGTLAIGINSPYYMPDGLVLETADGFVPCVWDTTPRDDINSSGIHIWRKIVTGVLEQSTHALVYDTGTPDSTERSFRRSLSHTDFTAEWIVKFDVTGITTQHSFDYRVQAGGDGYRVKFVRGAGLVLQKSSSGVFSDLASSSGALLGMTAMMHRLRLVVAGNVHTVFLDGEQQVSFTDSSSPFASGVTVGFAAKGEKHQVRCFNIRTADSVTINGLTNGQKITLRAPGTPPIATATVSGTSHTFSGISHFPAESVEIAGVNHVVSEGIWGGDVLDLRNNFMAKIDLSQITAMGANFAAYAAGTAYSLTATPAALIFGTTQPSITITSAGTYLLMAAYNAKYNGATFAAVRTVTLKIRRTNNTAADVANASRVSSTNVITALTYTFDVAPIAPVIYTTTNTDDVLTIFGDVSVVPSAGSLDIIEASIFALRIS